MTGPKKKKLLKWMTSGDPAMVPIFLSDAESTTASYFQTDLRVPGKSVSIVEETPTLITPEMILKCKEETGIHMKWNLGTVTFFDVLHLIDDIDITVKEQVGSGKEIVKTTTIETPDGVMSDIFITPVDQPACWKTHFVKSEKDFPAFTYLIKRVSESYTSDPAVKAHIVDKFQKQVAKWPDDTDIIFIAMIGIPCFVLTSNLFMGPCTAFELLFDHKSKMEELFEVEEASTKIIVDCAGQAGADFVKHAINGLEIFSPQIYEDYFVPQAAKLHTMVHGQGIRSWVHTCGYLKKLIELGVHAKMNIDLLESFSPPPFGDVDDLRESRKLLGKDIVTNGAVDVENFYNEDVSIIRQRVRDVIDQTEGYRHMISDTNDSYPPYRRENIMAVVEEVEKTGRMLRA